MTKINVGGCTWLPSRSQLQPVAVVFDFVELVRTEGTAVALVGRQNSNMALRYYGGKHCGKSKRVCAALP